MQNLKTLSSLNVYIEQSIKDFLYLPTSNLGLCPHPDEHEYELVKFQVFSQKLVISLAPFRHLTYETNRVKTGGRGLTTKGTM